MCLCELDSNTGKAIYVLMERIHTCGVHPNIYILYELNYVEV